MNNFRNTALKTAEIDRTRRISLGQIHPARINTKILTNMITQVFHQDHMKVDGLRNQTIIDSKMDGPFKTDSINIFDHPLFIRLWVRLIQS